MLKAIRTTTYLLLAFYMLPSSGISKQFSIQDLICDFSKQSVEKVGKKDILIRYSSPGKKRLMRVVKCIFPIVVSYYLAKHYEVEKGLSKMSQTVIYPFILLMYLALISAALKAFFCDVYIESQQEGLSLPDQCLKKGLIRSFFDFFTEFSLTHVTMIPYSNIALAVEKTERDYTFLGVPTERTYHVLKIFCHDGRLYELRIDRLSREDYDVHVLTEKLKEKGIKTKMRLAAT